nr:hypothetical protein [Actinomycetota bacterium]
ILGELTGPQGPFRTLTLTQSRSLLKSRTTFSGVVDLTGGTSAFVDPELRSKLGDGFKLDEKAFRFEVTARLPGETKTWSPPLGQQTVLHASAAGWRVVPVVPAVVAFLCAVGAVLLVVRRRRGVVSPHL